MKLCCCIKKERNEYKKYKLKNTKEYRFNYKNKNHKGNTDNLCYVSPDIFTDAVNYSDKVYDDTVFDEKQFMWDQYRNNRLNNLEWVNKNSEFTFQVV